MTIRIRILIAISLLSIALSSFILRVRTMDGQIYRFDVDEEIKTIKQCRNKLIEIGKISESSILKIKDNEFNESSEESLDSLSLTNGEIVTVVDMQPQKQTSNQSTSNKTTGEVTIDKSVSKKKLPATTSTSVSMKKKVVSIASMTAQKQSLEKIIRQKSSTIAQSVIVMPSTERIFNRIATGGVALLLGRTLQYKPTFKTKKSSVPSTTTASTSSTSDRSIERNLTVIYAAYELICSADENNNSDAISSKITDYDSVTFAAAIERQKDRISEVRAIAASMGLQIVGCCIGHPSIESSGSSSDSSGKKRVKKSLKTGTNDDDDTDGERWNADHIHSCVQLREQLGSHLSAIDQELFVTLR